MNEEKKLKDLPKRFVFSVIAIAVTFFLIFFSCYLAIKIIIFFILTACLAIALWEYKFILHMKEVFSSYPWLLLGGILQIIGFFLASFSVFFSLAPIVLFFLYFVFLIGMNLLDIEGAIMKIATTVLGIIYIAVPLSMIVAILYIFPSQHDGRLWLLYLIIVTKFQDIVAYFGGKLLGRHPITPHISPRKSWEGTIIGFLGAVGISVLFTYLCSKFFIPFSLSLISSIGLGAILAVMGQFGDFAESLFKRDAKLKNSNIVSGVGGVLDVFDSLLFTIPIIYFILLFY